MDDPREIPDAPETDNDELTPEERAEPYERLAQREDFQEWIRGKAGVSPPSPPPPSPEEVVRFRAHRADPDYQEIVEAMGEWSATLPESQRDSIDNSHVEFNRAYDRFAQAQRASRPAPAPQRFSTIEESIASKERGKRLARVEAPGGVVETPSPSRDRQKKMNFLKNKIWDFSLSRSEREAAEIQLIVEHDRD
jgi:hypothetical protein